MKKNIFGTAFFLFCTLITAGSCAGSDDTTQETTGNCIITQATMGSLVRFMPTKASDGTDSTYTVTVQGSGYPLTIDQLHGTICNLDSLPVGTDISRIVFSSFSASGTVSIKSLTTGNDTVFSASDSTDFSQIRLITAYATDGVSKRTYAIEIRRHQEWPDSTTWTFGGTPSEVAASMGGRAFAGAGQLTAFISTADGPHMLTAPAATPAEMTIATIGTTNLNVRSVQKQGNTYYATADGQVVRSTDGLTWTADGLQATNFTSLLAAGTKTLIATDGTYFYSSSDGARTWAKDASEMASMPHAGLSGTVLTSASDPTQERAYVIGTREGKSELWCRTLDTTGEVSHAWMHLAANENEDTTCPVLDNYTLLPYDGGLLLLGEAGGNLSTPVISYDGGHTWKSGILKRPTDATASTVCAAVGEGGQVFLLLGGTGQIWYGHINRLGWREVKKAYKE